MGFESSNTWRRWATRIGIVLLVGWFGLFVRAKMDGGASRGMPSTSAEDAERAGMLVRRVTVVVDSGGPTGVGGAWIEREARTDYRFGIFATRVPFLSYDGTERHMLCVAHEGEVRLTADAIREGQKGRTLPGGGEVTAWPVAAPYPDTIWVRATRPAGYVFYNVDWRGLAADSK